MSLYLELVLAVSATSMAVSLFYIMIGVTKIVERLKR
jgi:hypothetical protein